MDKSDKSKFTESKNYITYNVCVGFHNKDYDIEKSRLMRVRTHEKEFSNISEWVAHLSGKTWASKRMMLLLCDMIKRIHPNNEINWDETYRYIDSTKYDTV
jgi:hypothetical protein